jgi:TrwC relaxase/AAA domain
MLNFQKISAQCKGENLADYYSENASANPEPEGVDPAGRELESGEWLAAYYSGRNGQAIWRPDMQQAVADALGIDSKQAPKREDLINLFEGKRGDNGAAWSKHRRQISSFDFVFSPHKSISLAAEFAPTRAEAAAIRNAIISANTETLLYAAGDLGFTRRGRSGANGLEPGGIGWFSYIHDAARPTLALQDGPGGATYLMDAPVAGDPHYHLHNIVPNLVVTKDGHAGSIDARTLTADRVLEYGAYFQAKLADRLRALGARIGYDEHEQAAVLQDLPKAAVDLFSKRDRQILGDAKQYVAGKDLDWDELSLERKKKILHEASKAGRLGKTKDDEKEVWRAQAAEIGWAHESVIDKISHGSLTDDERFERAYKRAARHLAKEFVTAGVIDHDRLRVHAARGLIGAGISGGRDDVDRVVSLIEERGFKVNGRPVAIVKAQMGGKARITHTEQIRIEQSLCDRARQAAQDHSGSLSTQAIRCAMQSIEEEDPEIAFTGEQQAAIYAMGQGSNLTLLTGVAGSGKTTLLRPLVRAWKADGRRTVGISTAWRQADALKDADIEETFALQRFLILIDRGKFQPDRNTVLVVDEVSQIGPRPMLRLLELQAKTGMVIKMLGDREQCQSIEAGDTIELLRRVLPKFALPEILTAVRQKDPRDRKIAALFRQGRAKEALDMKRQDGTARLLEGDYDQTVAQIADFYVKRNDYLEATGKNLSMTVTALTNAEAADISQAIRARLKERGRVKDDEALYEAVYYRGDKAEYFNLPIATGDKLRLYRRTWATIGGRGGTIGNNGDIVEVVAKTESGLVLKNSKGRIGEVEWRRLHDDNTGRLLLGFGRAFTINAAQGMSTKGEHLNALARGTAGTNAFKIYPSESRATGRTYTFISKAAVDRDIIRSRALGDITPITDEDRWNRVSDDMAEKPYKSLAIDLLASVKGRRQHARDTAIRAHHRLEAAAASNPRLGPDMQDAAASAVAREAFIRQHLTIEDVIERCQRMLKEAAKVIMDHLAGKHSVQAAPPKAVAPARPLDAEFEQPAPPSPSPRI